MILGKAYCSLVALNLEKLDLQSAIKGELNFEVVFLA